MPTIAGPVNLIGLSSRSRGEKRPGLVMVCDVDVRRPDATRTHTVEVARNLAATGWDVELVARGGDPIVPGVRFRCAGPPVPSVLRRFVEVNAHATIALVVNRRAARACYLRHYWSLFPSIIVSKALRYRLVTQVDDVDYGPGFARPRGARAWLADRVRRLAARIMGRAASGIVAVTEGIKVVLARDFGVDPAKVRVLPNGVDLELFAPVSRAVALERSSLDSACRYVVFVGLFAPWVDFDAILRGFAEAACTRSGARLLLVGDGTERGKVETLVEELELGDRVELTGFVGDRYRVRDLMGAATVCVAAHRLERIGHIGVSPTKLAEYFAMGRAVVALAVPGVREAIGETGGGITVADARGMAAAVGRLLDDPDEADALGRAGRRAAEERYSWRSVVERTVPLLRGDV